MKNVSSQIATETQLQRQAAAIAENPNQQIEQIFKLN